MSDFIIFKNYQNGEFCNLFIKPPLYNKTNLSSKT